MPVIILSFIISYFLFSLGSNFTHLIYVMHEVVLKVNQNKFFNVCLNNKKGNLLELMAPEQVRSFAELNDFYHLIIRQNRFIKRISKPTLIKDNLKHIKKLKEDISLTTNEEYAFIDINHLLKRLSDITDDIWVSDKYSCKGNRYLGKNIMLDLDRKDKNLTKYCLLIKDNYTEAELKKMYKHIDENHLYEIVTIVINLSSYYIQNEKILENVENFLKIIEESHSNLTEKINMKRDSINKLVDLYLSLFPKMREKDSISDFFNCEILKDELIAYYSLNKNFVTYYCLLFGIISLAVGLLTFIGMILIINSIQWIYYEEYEKEYLKEEQQELEDIVEESDEEYGDDYDEKKT